MGEGGRRPGEGSFFDRARIFKRVSFASKEPSPALSGTLSHPGGRERGKIREGSLTDRFHMRSLPRKEGRIDCVNLIAHKAEE
jgi:hypothetical protein